MLIFKKIQIHETIQYIFSNQTSCHNEKPIDLVTPRDFSDYFRAIDQTIQKCEAYLKSDDWIQIGVKHQTERFVKDLSENAIQVIKSVGLINCNVREVVEALTTLDRWKSWEPFFEQGMIVETVDNFTHVIHLKFQAHVCILKRARDFILIRHTYEKPDGSQVRLKYSIKYCSTNTLPFS